MAAGVRNRQKEGELPKPTRYYSNKQEKQVAQAVGGRQTANSGATKANQATIEAIPDEENEQVLIIVDHNIEISKIVYKWNSQKEHTISGDGQNHLEKPIDLPSGTSTLNIKVFDKNGGETSKSFTFETAVKKDDVVAVAWSGSSLGTHTFRFVYAQGSESEAQ